MEAKTPQPLAEVAETVADGARTSGSKPACDLPDRFSPPDPFAPSLPIPDLTARIQDGLRKGVEAILPQLPTKLTSTEEDPDDPLTISFPVKVNPVIRADALDNHDQIREITKKVGGQAKLEFLRMVEKARELKRTIEAAKKK